MKNLLQEKILFFLILCISFLPLFFTEFIVTGDGPCHFYNSKILYDWHFNHISDFYKPFLQLNYHLEPNWITNVIQIPLLSFLAPQWVEKTFFGLYLIIFSFGIRKLIYEINQESVFLSSVGVIFAWNHILMMGFTNNSWSVALWFWVVAFWIQSLKSGKVYYTLVLALLMIIVYFSHPIGLSLSFLSIIALTAFHGIYMLKREKIRTVFIFYIDQAVKFLLAAIPAILLLVHFFLRKEWSAESNTKSASEIFEGLARLTALVNLNASEAPVALAFALFIILLFIPFIVARIKGKAFITPYDGLLLLFLSSIYIIFNPPSSFAGGLEVGIRLGMFPFLSLLFWFATAHYPQRFRVLVPVMALIFAGVFMALRLPSQIKASALASEIVSSKNAIRDKSTVLVLNYDWAGQHTDGSTIANKIWLFGHTDCYLGTYKSLVISDNYEANFWYFPLIEIWTTNMYKKTDLDGINFDNRPPRADILSFTRRTGGQKIDYVLMVSYRDEFKDHPYTQEILNQLGTAYHKVYTSAHSRAILYQRNDL